MSSKYLKHVILITTSVCYVASNELLRALDNAGIPRDLGLDVSANLRTIHVNFDGLNISAGQTFSKDQVKFDRLSFTAAQRQLVRNNPFPILCTYSRLGTNPQSLFRTPFRPTLSSRFSWSIRTHRVERIPSEGQSGVR